MARGMTVRTWILVAAGFVFGGIFGLMFDVSVSNGALLGAFAGFLIGRLMPRDTPAKTPPHAAQSPSGALGTPVTLAERVERLEAEVQTLRSELARVIGQTAAGVSPTPAVPPPHSETVTPTEPAAPPVPPVIAIPAGMPPELILDEDLAPAQLHDVRAVPTPAVSREPGMASRAWQAARNWLLGGNTVVRVGMIVLFFGVAFLLKYAADNSMMPIEFRLAGVALGATGLIALGWRIGQRRGVYGLVLQGGGIGVLYLTVFAATRLYHLLPVGAAFPLMVITCLLSAFLAVRQNASPLAFMGSAGGFLAPVLLATGGGSHVVLFSYYALLNAGIFAIAWFKAWRPLNLLGFVFTFTIGTVWGVTAYRPELLQSTEPFLVLFFLMYVGIALLYAVHRELELKHYVDGTLVFGTPIVAIGLQAALMRDIPFGLAWSAVALSGFYLAIAAWLARRRDRLRLMFEAMLALAVIFATLAVPLAFSGPTTSAAWAIEGAALVWMSVRQRRLVPFAFGVLMQGAAAVAFSVGVVVHPVRDALPVLNSIYIATLLIALAGLFSGWWLHGRNEAREWHAWMPEAGLAASAWGLAWWIGGGVNEIHAYAVQHVSEPISRFTDNALVLFAVATAWLAHAAGRKLAWRLADHAALALAPALSLLALAMFGLLAAPSTGLGIVAWPVAAVGGYLLLWRQQRDIDERWLAPLHTLSFWNLCGLAALEGYWRLRGYVPEGAWSWSAWAYGFGLILLALSGVGMRVRWPVARFARAYLVWGATPLVALLWAWSIVSVQSDGDASPLFWLPILNPLDVAQLLIVVAVFIWWQRLRELGLPVADFPVMLQVAVGATAFIWLNAMLLRTLHHWTGVAYTFDDMAHSTLVQASVSVFWTLCALALMIWATRRVKRPYWFVGAALLAVTVVKLFVFDLSHLQGIERIVSFIGIGVMLLLIGYFSPLPPKEQALMEGSR